MKKVKKVKKLEPVTQENIDWDKLQVKPLEQLSEE
jgi:hypothetical protein